MVVSASSMDSPTIPSVPDVVRAYARRFFVGDAYGWRGAPLTGVVFVSALLLVVPVGPTEWFNPAVLAIIVGVAAFDAAFREYRFGGPAGLILAAAVTTAVIASLVLAPFMAVREALGGPAPVPLLDVVVALGVLSLCVAYFGRRGWRRKAEAAFEAEVRAERARRGRGSTG
jgi:hypothetical protein